MSASKLPEALREALANVASAIDPISTTPRQVLIGVRSHLERAWPAVLAELAAQPEQAGGWEAVERAVAGALPCDCGEWRAYWGESEHEHRYSCPSNHRSAVLQALRSVELASAAREARLEDLAGFLVVLAGYVTAGDEEAISELHREAARVRAALSHPAQPSELWSGLVEIIDDLELFADRDSESMAYARRLRALLGLPPADLCPTKGQGPAGPQVPSEELQGGGE